MPTKPKMHRPAGYRPPQRPAADGAFYDNAPWRRTRLAYLAEHPLCADCEREGLVVPAKDVHHKTRRKDLPEEQWLDWDKLEGLCTAHHSRRTRRGE